MKVLFFGAGVLGSLYAARLHEAGNDVTLLARGSRSRDVREHGIVLERFDTGERTRTRVRVVNDMPCDEHFDLCVVLVQKTQLKSALEVLGTSSDIETFLFMNNTAEGPDEMVRILGNHRVMLGHVNAGGERDGHVVRYMVADKMTLGELDGSLSERLRQIADLFKSSGFAVDLCRNIDSWKRYHVALAVPFAYAMYLTGSCNYRLSRNREAVRMCLQGMREAFEVLGSLGYPMEPPKLRSLFIIPEFILVRLFQRMLRSDVADIGMARHLRNASEEMEQLAAELFVLIRRSEMDTPVLRELRQRAEEQTEVGLID